MPGRPKSKRSSFESKLEKALPVLAFLALGGSAAAHYYLHEPKYEAVREAVASVCDAIFIAAFLAKAVDPVLKKGLLKEGIKSIFRYVYGYSLPPSLQQFYEQNVAGTKELRTEFCLHWRLKPIASTTDLVSTRLHAKFRVVNFSNEQRFYNHRAFAIDDTPRAKGTIELLYCTDTDEGNSSVYHWHKDEILAQQAAIHKKTKELMAGYQYGPSMDLEPKNSNDKGRYLFGAIYSSEQTWPHGLDWFRFTEVTTGAEITITVEESLRNHYFTVIPAPPSDEDKDRKLPEYSDENEDWRCHWKFSRLFVPNEIVIVRWQPRDVIDTVPQNHTSYAMTVLPETTPTSEFAPLPVGLTK